LNSTDAVIFNRTSVPIPERALVSPDQSIFVSHVNGDPDAEVVLEALKQYLRFNLAPTHGNYEIFYDREITAGSEWWPTIWHRLRHCPAAIILISEQALDPCKPWVSHECTFLRVYQNWRPELCIIPVLLAGSEGLLQTSEAFKPSKIWEIQALRFPISDTCATVEQLVAAIAELLKRKLPPDNQRHLTGLAAPLAAKSAKFPKSTLGAIADAAGFRNPNGDCNAVLLAVHLLGTNETDQLRGFGKLCSEVPHEIQLKKELAAILGSQSVSDEVIAPIAIEAATAVGSALGRAFVIDIWNISKIYAES
jgi:hypothetical protein